MYDTTKPYKKQILELIKQTWNTPYITVKESNPYPIIHKKFLYSEADSVDGIGTKGMYHWQQRSFRNAALDALAMNLNDLVLARARPYKLLDHITIPRDDKEAVIEIVETLVEECKMRKIAIPGGETSIHENENTMDISICASGWIDYKKENNLSGILIGIASNGLHSNGFTKVRGVFKGEFRTEFIEPTLIYSDLILSLKDDYNITGMMHITGGAFTKLKDILKEKNAIIHNEHKLKPHSIFYELYEKGISDEEMYKIFNCGIGFILSASKRESKGLVKRIEALGFESDIIGEVIPGKGEVKISSMFSNKTVDY